jgi:hypothetical protein
MKQTIVSLVIFASMLVGAAPGAQAGNCTNATLQGGYGFFASVIILPAGTPRSILGVLTFDGKGTFTAALTFNTGGVISHPTDTGPYNVNADCTGQLITNGGTGTVDIVIVDGGKEFYQLRTNPPTTFFQFNSAKKQIPDENQQ